MKSGLSVAVITFNEEKRLASALESVRFADEIIVVDSGSTDSTLKIAESYGANVVTRPWPGFGAQKNFAIGMASHEWVLSLDADECVTEPLAEEIQKVARGEMRGYDLYSIPRLSMFIDRWMKHGGWYPDRQIRLLRAGSAEFSERRVHEALETGSRPVGRLSGDLLHYSYESVSDYVTRMNTYSSLAAEMALEKSGASRGSVPGLWWALTRKFLEVYVYKRGFMDGKHGFVVSVLAAYGVFLRDTKVWKPEDR